MPVKKRRFKPNALFWRLMLSFVSLLLPMVLITVLYYNNAVQKAREDLSAKVGLNLAASISVVDTDISTTHAAGMMLLDTDVIKQSLRPASVSTPQQKIDQISIITQIGYARSVAGRIVENMFIYLDDTTVYADGQYDFSDYFERYYQFKDYPAGYWADALKSVVPYEVLPATAMSIPLSADTRTVVPTLIRLPVAGYRMVLAINLSTREINDTLNENSILPGIEYTVADANGKLILSGASQADAGRLTALPEAQQAVSMTLNGTPCIVMQKKSSFTGWRYFAAIPLASFSGTANGIFQLILVFAVLLIIGLLLSYYFTLQIYLPIKSIRNSLDLIKPADAANDTEPRKWSNDFDEIGRGIAFLLNNYSEAHEENLSMLGQYLDASLLQVLSSRPPENLSNVGKLLMRDFGFHNGPYRCVSALFKFSDAFNEELQDTERLNLIANLKHIVGDVLKKHVPCYVLEHRENLYVCVLSTDGEGEAGTRAALEELLKLFPANEPYCTVTIGIGKPCGTLEGLAESFNQASAALAGYAGMGSAIVEAGGGDPPKLTFDYPLQDEMALTQSLSAGNAGETLALLDAVLQRNMRLGISLDGFELLIQELYITGMRFLAGRNETLTGIAKYRDLGHGGRFVGDYGAAGKLLHSFFKDVLATSGNRGSRVANLSDTIAEYVQKNYSHDLYLEKIAEDMGLSVKYISKVFKEKTGQNLSDYINSVRMDHVKDMLLHTDYPVGKIAELVGVYSRTTFVRLFRKREGVTPSEFRELMRGPV